MTSSISTENFLVNFEVTPAALRVLALPSLLPEAVMRAGVAGGAAFFTLYNVDINSIFWYMRNCSQYGPVANTDQPVQFSTCGDTNQLDVGAQVPIGVRYNAPELVGAYTAEHILVGDSLDRLSSSSWILETEIRVIPNSIVASRSSVTMADDTLIAGQEGTITVVPRDMYSNLISDFALLFTAYALDELGNALSFDSFYEMDTGSYAIVFSIPRAAQIEMETKCASEPVPPMLFMMVASVACDVASVPNEAGAACVCIDGLARLPDATCGRCSPGTQPKPNREQGCESCTLFAGTVSVSGLSCERCSAGLMPATTLDTCVPCANGMYFDQINQACNSCFDGFELDTSDGAMEPCKQCDPLAAGRGGFCTACPSGTMPNNEGTECDKCPLGYAGTNGICELCPAGSAPQMPDQHACINCVEGTYRNDEQLNDCLKCTVTMTSPPSALTSGSCYCPEGTYDINDNRAKRSPIWCFPNGLQSSPHLLDENKISGPDIALGRRCIRCPGCLDCTFDGYVGDPMVHDGWTVVNDNLPELIAPETPKLSMYEFVDRPRHVFGCPFGGIDDNNDWRGGPCISEQSYSSATSVNGTQMCEDGYVGYLCSVCDQGYDRTDSGCEKCDDAEGDFGEFVIIVLLVVFFFAILVPCLRKNQNNREKIDALG